MNVIQFALLGALACAGVAVSAHGFLPNGDAATPNSMQRPSVQGRGPVTCSFGVASDSAVRADDGGFGGSGDEWRHLSVAPSMRPRRSLPISDPMPAA